MGFEADTACALVREKGARKTGFRIPARSPRRVHGRVQFSHSLLLPSFWFINHKTHQFAALLLTSYFKGAGDAFLEF